MKSSSFVELLSQFNQGVIHKRHETHSRQNICKALNHKPNKCSGEKITKLGSNRHSTFSLDCQQCLLPRLLRTSPNFIFLAKSRTVEVVEPIRKTVSPNRNRRLLANWFMFSNVLECNVQSGWKLFLILVTILIGAPKKIEAFSHLFFEKMTQVGCEELLGLT